jgi:hypothetical protein
LTDGADLFTNGNQLNVLTQATVDGAGTTIRVDPHTTPGTAVLTTADLDLNNGGALVMNGGIANASTLFEVNVGSVLTGHGTVNVGDTDLVAEQAFENSGLIQVNGDTTAPRTLTIHANGVDTIDLDGDATDASFIAEPTSASLCLLAIALLASARRRITYHR